MVLILQKAKNVSVCLFTVQRLASILAAGSRPNFVAIRGSRSKISQTWTLPFVGEDRRYFNTLHRRNSLFKPSLAYIAAHPSPVILLVLPPILRSCGSTAYPIFFLATDHSLPLDICTFDISDFLRTGKISTTP